MLFYTRGLIWICGKCVCTDYFLIWSFLFYEVSHSTWKVNHTLSSSHALLVAGPSTSLTTMSLLAKNTPSRSEMTKVQQQVKVNGASMTALRREMQEVRVKQLEQQKQLQDQEQKLLEQTQVIGEQNARLAELEHKLRELMDSAVGGVTPSSGSRPAVASTSASSSAGSPSSGTAVAATTPGAMATATSVLPGAAEGDCSPPFKRTRKSSDLPRQSKRLRCKK